MDSALQKWHQKMGGWVVVILQMRKGLCTNMTPEESPIRQGNSFFQVKRGAIWSHYAVKHMTKYFYDVIHPEFYTFGTRANNNNNNVICLIK